MKETTIDLIRTVLRSDETVPPEHLDSILKACRQTAVRRKLIGAKTAMEILQISRPTLREYITNPKGGSTPQGSMSISAKLKAEGNTGCRSHFYFKFI